MLQPASKITCEVDRSLAAQAQRALAAAGIGLAQVHSRRSVVLRERAALRFLPPTMGLEEDPVEVFELYVPRSQARDVLLACARELRLFAPGRGAIYAEQVQRVGPMALDSRPGHGDGAGQDAERLSPLALINCVVQRGHGNDIARRALELGTLVPTVNFGVGTGVRDRIGLLRIAIPAEKEVVSLLVEPEDRDETMAALVDAGRLDQPGRGFIAAYPVEFGVGNPRVFRGPQRHRATMEQVISAIDELKAGSHWRSRSREAAAPQAKRCYLAGLLNVTLDCNEGWAGELAAAAMAAGAGGATITKAKRFSPTGEPLTASPARELIDFGLAPDRLERLLAALRERGAFEADVACAMETKPLPLALTYLAE
jgi:hypothetical protein